MESLMMGEYGSYVWTSFGMTFVALVVMMLQSRRRQQGMLDEIRARIKAMESEQ